ncbi:MAG: tail fiber domain-containing protein [Bacteroidota bacterium]
MTTFASSFPIAFTLTNEEEENVLYITDEDSVQDMTLTISNNSTNSSTETLTLVKLSGDASADNHHFELVFRPDTLYNSPPNIALVDTSSFSMSDASSAISPNEDGTYSLYYKANSSMPLGADAIQIVLSGMRAASDSGTRSTRVLLRYQNIMPTGASSAISGFREIPLNVVNHLGKKNIPLHVGFDGLNLALNNGISNDLNIRVQNISNQEVVIGAESDSKLYLAISTSEGSTDSWALSTLANLDGLSISFSYATLGEDGLTYTKVDKGAATGSGEALWEVPFTELQPGDYIEISLSGLITNDEFGIGHIYLYYENIPNYWDDKFVLHVEKTPIYLTENKLGINTKSPYNSFEVSGNAIIGSGLVGQFLAPDNGLLVEGNVGIGASDPTAPLHVQVSNEGLNIPILAKNRNSSEDGGNAVGIGFHNEFSLYRDPKAAIVHERTASYGRGTMHFLLNNTGDSTGATLTDARMSIQADGSVGIGTTDPGEKLEVNGGNVIIDNGTTSRLRFENGSTLLSEIGQYETSTMFIANKQNGATTFETNGTERMRVHGNGKVSIGTTSSPSKFCVSGGSGYAEGGVLMDAYEIKFTNSGQRHWSIFNESSTGKFLINDTSSKSQTGTAGTNYFAITTSGKVGIGTDSPGSKLTVGGDIRVEKNDNWFKMSLSSNKLVFSIGSSVHGSNKAMSWDGDTNWDNASDMRLKTDIESENNILPRLMQLDVKNYRWKSNPDAEVKRVGLMAQEVQPLFPALVGTIPNKETEDETLALKHALFGILAIGGLKELKQETDGEIESLKEEIRQLKNQLNQFQA